MHQQRNRALGQCAQYLLYAPVPPLRKRVAREIAHAHADFLPANALYFFRRELGAFWANLILFGPCLAIGIALDWLIGTTDAWKAVIGAVACCLAFDVLGDGLCRKLFKLGFLALTIIIGGYWTVAVAFLITFENITWEGDLK